MSSTTSDVGNVQPTIRSSAHDAPDRTRWLILGVLGLAQLMVVLDATVVNIALPAAQLDLGFDNADRSWVVTSYALAFGSLLLLGGRLSDLFGRRTTFLVGLVGFAVMSAVGGAAVNFGMLVAARAGQGVFGALLAPAALSLLTTTFTNPKERAKAFGIFGAVAGAGGAIGLLLGGVLTEWANWRWSLYVNLIFAGIAFVGGFLLLAKHRATERPVLDIPGTITVSAALFSIVYGFAHAESDGWSNAVTIGFLAVGVVLLGVFVYLQTRATHPLLPLRIVLDRTRGGAYLAVFVIGAGMFAVFLFLTYYLQSTLGYTPITTGFAFLPMIATLVVTATVATSVILPRFGPRVLMSAGMLIASAGMALLAQISIDSSYAAHILPSLLIMGVGMGATMAPAMQGAVSGVSPEDAGVASATVNTMQQIGGSIGTALLSTIAATAATNYATDNQAAVAQAADPQAAATLLRMNAEIASYTTTFWWASAIFLAGSVMAALLVRSGKLPDGPEGATVVAH
ncbi:MFS transporter [Rhodococcus sp. BP-349]|uniref:MFS transporter n=1 Tax=unclassified Rhodococcus (in: high G+C Gram-positive bacteria) TaxID=192944 RepID=UPI001C9B062D|nr:MULTISPECIES: MFS transporter [unclassified Rhodococcus (in: high G+C Gram-positive bacteria)]MBY6540489.1 MFS transporter [Rhodococcus sp. BP-363]MBY6545486.1 MFS transporter [Rhodococcus sp. BP-369]MBY6564716.1 MFS transporter [Rhodococcus sp. BP-370]MBY6578348.1 MFS transporter [Rhodococcus sp. BP-364]MBY6587649.1 MFS transporter [Rhodococcus sp. BP-358]